MWDKIKAHPWIVGGVIGLFLLVLVLSSSNSSPTAAPTASGGSDASGNQLQAYMAALNQQGQIAQLQSNAQSEQTAAGVTVAQLEASSKDLANTLAAQVAEYTTKAQSDYATQHDTLAAQIAQKQIDANTQQQQIASNTSIQQATIYRDILSYSGYLNAATSMHNTDVLAGALANRR